MRRRLAEKFARGVFGLSLVTLVGVAAVLATGVASSGGTPMVVYKDPNCGCCTRWAEQLDEQGFDTDVRAVGDMASIKQEAGVPGRLSSCHTAKVEGYFIEGHVPASDIRRLLEERPRNIAGLTAPGMPLGSPGMEVPGRKPQSYTVYAIDREGKAHPFASH